MHCHCITYYDGGDVAVVLKKGHGNFEQKKRRGRGGSTLAITADRIKSSNESKDPKSHWTALAEDCRAINKEMGWSEKDHQRMLKKARRMINADSR